MQAGYADQLARLQALTQARQPLPPDLAAWAYAHLERAAPAGLRLRWRDSKLRMAALFIGGSAYAQTQALLAVFEEISESRRRGETFDPGDCLVRRLVLDASLLAKLPGERQLGNVLSPRRW